MRYRTLAALAVVTFGSLATAGKPKIRVGVNWAFDQHFGERFVISGERESQSGVDINGDGDMLDVCVTVVDGKNGRAAPLSRAGAADGPLVKASSKWSALFPLSEADDDATDMNADGDAVDFVLHAWTPKGGLVNLGLAVEHTRGGGRYAFLTVSEADQGDTDLNGDGDALDHVMHVVDTRTLEVWNTGLAAPRSTVTPANNGSYAAVRVLEDAQNNTPLNGDGDTDDEVLHYLDLVARTSTNLQLAVRERTFSTIQGPKLRYAPFEVIEDEQSADLNGDLDQLDTVVHVLNFMTGEVENIGVAGAAYTGGKRFIAYGIDEAAQGDGDLDGNGDALHVVLHVRDMKTDVITNTETTVDRGSPRVQAAGRHILFLVDESDLGVDLDGSGVPLWSILHSYDTKTGVVTNLRMSESGGSSPRFVTKRHVADYTTELGHNQDLDGDADLNGNHIYVADLKKGTTRIILSRVDRDQQLFGRGRKVVTVVEEDFLERDVSGDDDTDDRVVAVIDIRKGKIRPFPLIAGSASGNVPAWAFVGRHVAALVQEVGIVDLNGDGDMTDRPIVLVK